MGKNKFGFNTKHLNKGDVVRIDRSYHNSGYYVKISYDMFIGFTSLETAVSHGKINHKNTGILFVTSRKKMNHLINIVKNAEVIHA